ncbi:MAG: hypothetical protein AAFY71_05300 [Bacteroidota bacterium]
MNASHVSVWNRLGKCLLLVLCLPLMAAQSSLADKCTVRGQVQYPSLKSRLFKGMKNYDGHHMQAQKPKKSDGIVMLIPLDRKVSAPPTPKPILTQRGMNFLPRVLPVTVGSTVYILNEDNEYHNVFSRTPGATFNIGRRPPGHLHPQKIKRAGVVRVFCDIHEHMAAYILSLNTPYFIRVKADATYELKNIPAGRYRMELFHPNFPRYKKEITVGGASTLQHDIKWR